MKTSNRLILSTSPQPQPARKLRRLANFALRQRLSYRRTLRYHTGKERDPETGLYYFGARYLDPKASRWMSGDPAVGEYIPVAPVNEEAKKHNQNLPGMGGVFNYVNLHIYHYAGNNPVKYVDPDGRDIYTVMLLGSGSKLVVGGSIDIGIAWDDNNNFCFVVSVSAGVGLIADVNLPIAPTFTIERGVNIDELKKIPFTEAHYSFDASARGISADVGVFIGVVFEINKFENGEVAAELVGGSLGTIGGGVDFVNLTFYSKCDNRTNNFSTDQKAQLRSVLDANRASISTESYNALLRYLE